MKTKSICIALIAIIMLLVLSFKSYSQTYNCSGTPDHIDVCGGTYISLTFSCHLNPLILPSGLSYTYDATNLVSVIQGVPSNSENSVALFILGSSTPFMILYIHATPAILTTTPASVCEGATINLNATSSAGAVNWYNVSVGGSSIATGTSYSPSVTTTTTYYVDATNSGTGYSCTTSSRTTVLAIVSPNPVIVNKEIFPLTGCTNGNKSGIRIKAIEGSGHYSYHWNTGDTLSVINCLADSNYYKVTVTDTITHCIGTDSIWLAPEKSDSIAILQEKLTLLRIDTAVKAWEILYLKNQLAQGKYTSYDTLNISLVLHDTTYVIDMHNLDTIVNLNGFTSNIKIYPNPMGELLNIECLDEMTKCEVYNLAGVAVISNIISTDKTQLDVSSLVTGEYMLKITLAKGGTIAGRLLIKK
jgi:hypothetical protein